MKRFLTLVFTLLCVLSLAGCTVGRKNSAGNLKITKYDKASNTYTLQYIETKLDFGKFYLIIENETITKMYCEYNAKKYKLGDSYVTIGGYSTALNKTSENGKATIQLNAPFKLVKSVEDGVETLNDQSLTFYVQFIDVNTPEDGSSAENLIDSASIKLTTNSNDLLTFIRNESPKTSK